jgi:ABC-2 type transport system ATP-binding protein
MSVGIEVENLSKIYTSPPAAAARPGGFGPPRFGVRRKQPAYRVVAVDGLSLSVAAGEILGLLGPNGAGKSTTVGILTTMVRPTSGDARIGQHSVTRDRVAVKRLIGVVPQRPNVDRSLTAREVLTYHAAYFNVPAAERERRAADLLDRFQLSDRADHLVNGFSGGMLQRLSIARAMMHDPAVLFLDEPSAGLDPQTRIMLWETVREYHDRARTILLTTHNMEEADTLCERIAIIDRGRVIALGTPDELKRSMPGGYVLQLQFDRLPEPLLVHLGQLPGVTEVRPAGETGAEIFADRGGPLVAEIVNAAVQQGIGVRDIHISEPSLENLFLHHTGRSLRQ